MASSGSAHARARLPTRGDSKVILLRPAAPGHGEEATMTAPPPRAYRGRGAESGAKCGASDSGAVVAPRARRRRMDGFAPRERAYRLRDLGIEMYSWALRWGPCPCAPVFSSLSGISPRATTTHPLIRQYGAEKREREREKKKRQASPPMCRSRIPGTQSNRRRQGSPSCLPSHTLSILRPALETWGSSCRIRPLACAPTKAGGKSGCISIMHAGPAAPTLIRTNTRTRTHIPSYRLLPAPVVRGRVV